MGATGPTGATGSTGATGVTGPTGTTTDGFSAIANVSAGASFTAESGFSSIASPSTGIYNLTLTTPAPSIAQMAVVVSLRASGAGSTISYAISSTSVIQVTTFDSTATPANEAFTIVLFIIP